MAAGTQLKMRFGTLAGTKTFTIKYAKPAATAAAVSTLMDAMITNGSIYEYPPTTKESATLVTTTETSLTIS